MPRSLIASLFLALIAVLSGPASAADRLSTTILGEKLWGSVVGHGVIADLNGLAITVFGTDSTCARDYYLSAATSTMPSNRPVSLDVCEVQLCTNPELRATCKGQPDKRSVSCKGTIEYQQGTLLRVEVNYQVERWKLPVCTKAKDEAVSKVIILNLPVQSDSKGSKTLPSLGDLTKCASHAYLPGSHPLHGEGCN
jgi:hypothetical protein